MSDPYRAPNAQQSWSDEAEINAIGDLAGRKQRVEGLFLSVGVGAAFFAAAGVFLFGAEVDHIPLLGQAGWMRARLILAAVPIAVFFGIGKLWVARSRERWLAEASTRFNVPVDALRWVLK